MTDEEKAIKAVCEECDSYWYCFNKKQLGDCVYNRMYVKGLEEGRKETEKQWHDCFLSCSSPYCAGHFPTVKMEGELGNMSKHEG